MLDHPVEGSTNIKHLAYDTKECSLFVTFLNGTRYQYFEVPQKVYTHLCCADSVGAALSKLVKGHYPFAKVDNG